MTTGPGALQFLADENFPRASVLSLRGAGHQVVAISEIARGAQDVRVVEIGRALGAVILTFDRDYGHIAMRDDAAGLAGLVLMRFIPTDPSEPALRLLALMGETPEVLAGRLTILYRDRFRQRPLRG